MSFTTYANQNRPRALPSPHTSQPTRQDCQWLTELQQHVTALNDIKFRVPELKREYEDTRKQIAQFDRELGRLQDQINHHSNCRWSRHSNNNSPDYHNDNAKIRLREEFGAVSNQRERSHERLTEIPAEHKRLQGEIPGHERNIQYLMKRLRLVVVS